MGRDWKDRTYCFCPGCGSLRLQISKRAYRYQPGDAHFDVHAGSPLPTFQIARPLCSR
jgi:hypothetical protein